MKHTSLLTAICCVLSLFSCGQGKSPEPFAYSKPVDLSVILQAYDWCQNNERKNMDSILHTMIAANLLLMKNG